MSNQRGHCCLHTVIFLKQARSRKHIWFPLIAIALAAVSVTPASGATGSALYSFNWMPPPGALNPGSGPTGTLLPDASGALYGATSLGGAYYNGAIFKLTPPAAGQTGWQMSVLYSFTGGFDGGSPNPGLVMDASGAIYGSASSGGSWLNQGLVFKLTPPAPGMTQWTETVLHYFYHSYSFGADDGANPSGGLIMDSNGALYGTTDLGGDITNIDSGFGTVFKLTPVDAAKTVWAETVLYRFKSLADGTNPMFQLTMDASGSLYGSTLYGGTGPCVDFLSEPVGCGTVFKLTPPGPGQVTWTKTTLHHFSGGADGNMPEYKLLVDASGAVYGTTYEGGYGRCTDWLSNVVGCGVVFKLVPPAAGNTAWTESVLYSFSGPDGAYPQGGLILDGYGGLIGTASGGGPVSYGVVGGYGLVFRLSPPANGQQSWTQTVLYNFDIRSSGSEPVGELIRDLAGHLFGVTYSGGEGMGGTVYELIL
jgi:hypothetical protein